MKAEVVELPLFPLNVVLFPGQTLPLHIFEPRYRLMIQRCIEGDRPFGVVLAQDDDATHSIGTAAKITQVEQLPDGRMNILTVGTERFELRDVRVSDDGYLVGDALACPFDNDVAPDSNLAATVAPKLARYLQFLARMTGAEVKTRRMPEDHLALAVYAAITLQLPLDDKQELLSIDSVSELLEFESDVLDDELFALSIMSAAVRPPETDSSMVFSVN
jgi:Lon protease-like protein